MITIYMVHLLLSNIYNKMKSSISSSVADWIPYLLPKAEVEFLYERNSLHYYWVL